ncbi:MAG: DNA translocase FtsK 4TM domain-containing protein [Deltaproteobacteria bacterium]|nr:DNA translocase FtsK 4TM domain-containing protein [Deltaproteobacteria bacterium]
MVASARLRREHRKELSAIFALAIGVFLALCLISYDPADPALNVASNMAEVTNLGGPVGAYTADILFTIFGVSAYVVVAVCVLISILLFLGRQVHLNWRQCLAYLVMIFAAAAMLHIRFTMVTIRGQPVEAGGLVGGVLGALATTYLNIYGAYILASALFAVAFFYVTQLSLMLLCRWSWQLLYASAAWAWQWSVIYAGRLTRAVPKLLHAIGDWWLRWMKARALAQTRRKNKAVKISRPLSAQDETAKAAPPPMARRKPTAGDEERDGADGDKEDAEASEMDDANDDRPGDEDGETSEEKVATPKIYERQDRTRRLRPSQLELTRISGHYVFPALGLLNAEGQKTAVIDEANLRARARLLESKLVEYGIHGRVTEIHPGPVVTMYEYEPAAGVKVNKIVGAEDDLSVTMGGRAIRIVSHIPGKAAVGIEVPNMERETVWLKEIIGDPKFRRANSKLPLAMGKDIEGHTIVADLTKMPHLLVAGATGSGKSVAINCMITSVLYKATPADVRMILVDPKMLELSIYDGIPHLLLPVVTKPKDATLALKWALREMERRYRLLSDAGVRNIIGYNEKVEKGLLELVSEEEAETLTLDNPDAAPHTGKIPYILIVIDEMADLMMVAGRDIEETVTRLAQMARASGIHLILATQRPSVDVITGIIKANFPSRIAFKVSSKHDARTIIDTVGAEQLLGMGDMLFLAPNTSNLIRIHGGFITENEVQRVVTHCKQQAEAIYDETILQQQETGSAAGGEEEYDELYDQAVRIVTDSGQASISMVQRRLRIGYNRAARLIERMEVDGIVGPPDGSKPRQVLAQSHSS